MDAWLKLRFDFDRLKAARSTRDLQYAALDCAVWAFHWIGESCEPRLPTSRHSFSYFPVRRFRRRGGRDVTLGSELPLVMAIEVRTPRQFYESDQFIECDCSNNRACAHSWVLRLEMANQRLGWDCDFYAGRDALAGQLLLGRISARRCYNR